MSPLHRFLISALQSLFPATGNNSVQSVLNGSSPSPGLGSLVQFKSPGHTLKRSGTPVRNVSINGAWTLGFVSAKRNIQTTGQLSTETNATPYQVLVIVTCYRRALLTALTWEVKPVTWRQRSHQRSYHGQRSHHPPNVSSNFTCLFLRAKNRTIEKCAVHYLWWTNCRRLFHFTGLLVFRDRLAEGF